MRLPSEQQWRTWNAPQRQRAVLVARDALLAQAGGGPYPKVSPDVTGEARGKMLNTYRETWPAKRTMHVEAVVRRPYDAGAPALCVLWNALQHAGWAVSDHPRWLAVDRLTHMDGDDMVFLVLKEGVVA